MAGAGFKTFVAGQVLGASDVNNYLMQQSLMVFSNLAAGTASIGTAVSEGMHLYDLSTNIISAYDGSTWVPIVNTSAWTAYTPTFTNITLGNGSTDFSYIQIGKTVHVRGRLTFGSTTSISGAATFSLPASGKLVGYGSAILRAAAADYEGVAVAGTTGIVCSVFNSAGTYSARANTSATVPATWTTGDLISFSVTYEAA